MGRGSKDRFPTAGQALLQVLVAATLACGVSVAVGRILTLNAKGARHVELRTDITALRSSILDALDCNETFAGIDMAADCMPASGAPRYLVLKRGPGPGQAAGSGDAITGELEPDATSPWFGSGKLGDYHVRAYCDTGEASLHIEVARPGASLAGFYVDPLTKRELAWGEEPSRGLNPIFGGRATPICRGKFDGVPPPVECAAGHYAVGFNVDTRQPVCKPLTPEAMALLAPPTILSKVETCRTEPIVATAETRTWGCHAQCPVGTVVTGGGVDWAAVKRAFGRATAVNPQRGPAHIDNGYFCEINISKLAESCTTGDASNGCGTSCYAICTSVHY